jgi:hypothetical protein
MLRTCLVCDVEHSPLIGDNHGRCLDGERAGKPFVRIQENMKRRFGCRLRAAFCITDAGAYYNDFSVPVEDRLALTDKLAEERFTLPALSAVSEDDGRCRTTVIAERASGARLCRNKGNVRQAATWIL